MYVLVICEKSGLVVMFCLLDVGEANLASSVGSGRSWLETNARVVRYCDALRWCSAREFSLLEGFSTMSSSKLLRGNYWGNPRWGTQLREHDPVQEIALQEILAEIITGVLRFGIPRSLPGLGLTNPTMKSGC